MAPGRLISGSLSGASSDASLSDGDGVLDRAHKRRRISKGESPVGPRIKYDAPSRIKKTVPTLDVNTAKSTLQTVLTTDTSFEALNVAPWLLHSMSALEIKHPTPIQRACIPEILQGRDCIGGSRTGTGKTIAFAVPILQKWSEDPTAIFAVVLTPTRELALQIYEQFKAISSPQSLKAVLVTGGSDMRAQAIALGKRPHVVIATPGRLADHIRTSG